MLNAKRAPGGDQFELGDKTETWDGRLAGSQLFEVVQALPKDEYKTLPDILLELVLPEAD
jgi:hypothetical protein